MFKSKQKAKSKRAKSQSRIKKSKRDNELLSSVIHFIGFLLALAALTLMVIFASLRGTASHIVGVSIFGTTLVMLYAISSFYHFLCKTHRLKPLLKKFDDASIFLLIAGTYTPIALALPNKGWGWSIFGVVWGLALLGMALKLTGHPVRREVSWSVYAGVAILLLVAAHPIATALPLEALFWVGLGGLFYRFGIVTVFLTKWFPLSRHIGWHEIIHVLIIAGSFSHFWLMLNYIVYI